MMPGESVLVERVRSLRGVAALTRLFEGFSGIYLVGGAVRDAVIGRGSPDLDLVIEGDAGRAATAVAAKLGGAVTVHDDFGTATVVAEELSFDLAAARAETYAQPGALPSVRPASIADDLARRDFSINAVAVSLRDEGAATAILDPHGGLADIDRGAIRILHDSSFEDDPTRILRAIRYEARLRMRMDASTERRAESAVRAGALATVSFARLAAELDAILGEEAFPMALARMCEFGIDQALGLELDSELAASTALAGFQMGAERASAARLALVSASREADATGSLLGLGLEGARARSAVAAAEHARFAARALRRRLKPSELDQLLGDADLETLALAIALGAPAEPISTFVHELRQTRLEIDGSDLLRAGVPEGPRVGEALRATRRLKLDGLVGDRADQLVVALDFARRE